MAGIRLSARIFILLVSLSALVLLAVNVATRSVPWATENTLIALGLAGLMTLATTFELRLNRETSVTLNTSIIMAAILLLEPDLAMLVAGSGLFADLLIKHNDWPRAVFGSAEAMLQAGLGGLILSAWGWDRTAIAFETPAAAAIVFAAGSILLVVNSVAVGTIIALQTRQSIPRLWWNLTRFGRVEEVTLLALGVLGAALVNTHIWTLPLLVVPGAVVYVALERNLRLQQQTVEALAALADVIDLRYPGTSGHSLRVAEYARKLAITLDLDPDEVTTIEHAARLHDIGMVVIDSSLTGRSSNLDAGAWEQIRLHPVVGVEILSRFPQLSVAASYVRHHHERIDGSGYPDGLEGNQISLGARIVAVADAFDAILNTRPHRAALRVESALAELRCHSGSQWDATVVDALLRLVANGEIFVPGAGFSGVTPDGAPVRAGMHKLAATGHDVFPAKP